MFVNSALWFWHERALTDIRLAEINLFYTGILLGVTNNLPLRWNFIRIAVHVKYIHVTDGAFYYIAILG